MKGALVALIVAAAAAIAAAAGVVLVVERSGHTKSSSDRELAEALGQRLREQEARIARLEEAVAGVREAVAGLGEASEGRIRRESAPDDLEDGGAVAGARGAGKPDAPGPAADLAGALEDGRADALREFVFNAIRQEREERRAASQRRAEERQREREELGQGPYGKYNFRVNSMAKKLGFDVRQKEYFYGTLVALDEDLAALRKSLDPRDRENWKVYREQREARHAQFDTAVLSMLSPAQAETFNELPEWERRGGGGDAIFVTATADGGEMAIEHAIGPLAEPIQIEIDAEGIELPPLPLPVPPPEAEASGEPR